MKTIPTDQQLAALPQKIEASMRQIIKQLPREQAAFILERTIQQLQNLKKLNH